MLLKNNFDICKLWREFNYAASILFFWSNKMKLTLEEFLKRKFCGAKTRAGTQCKRKDLYENGRCKLHGGLSTGPRTPDGKEKSAKDGFKKPTLCVQ